MRDRRRLTALAAGAALVVVAVLGWLLWPRVEATLDVAQAPEASTTLSARPAPRPATVCAGGARQGFVPTSISIAGVVRNAAVVGVPRDAAGVPGVLPVRRKLDFAWDLGGIEPGSRRGQVLLNTHTWPDGSAMGNRLLADLGVGDRLLVRGEGRHLCYRVRKQVEVPFADGYPGYGRTTGAPTLVIVVCSGDRLGPGEWTHRTLWFAEPVA